MKQVEFNKPVLSGELLVPGDKSISHRAVMLGSIAKGRTHITGFLNGDDCLRTIEMFKQLGVSIERKGTEVTVESPGMQNWKTPDDQLYAGNSGTTARLMLGILAGSTITSTLTGDESLSLRPMNRVTIPLQMTGAKITGKKDANLLPLTIKGSPLTAIDYVMPVASAQVKSAILFAGLNADGTTTVTEDKVSRDHTERMLMHFGAKVDSLEKKVSITGGHALEGIDVHVPGDISSAAFFMVAAAMIEGSSITFENVGLNPTRTGIIDVLQEMGASVEILNETNENGEPAATVKVTQDNLRGTTIGGALIPRLIDELPVIALLATQAKGTTIIKDAEELRVKETDRIAAVTTELKKLGANIEATDDGMIIHGPTPLRGSVMDSYGDHRLGMMAAIAALATSGPVSIKDSECINISYPNFFEDLDTLVGNGSRNN
ncbi:3-phosphoshikimate 1-carboxyvinyltransferase [Sporosarcina sp. G11-34]|uniref:3-phosphoshikimate 1-carboxyvinyltransferase n=1 Tax=Sporosarcina sp. G11-34 TaxID=2849605 RepID=UPI003FA71AD2|nr:3-phosphoshikimate 1-carboxyvinyltransferase [Sporosarcina sp. G11-34]